MLIGLTNQLDIRIKPAYVGEVRNQTRVTQMERKQSQPQNILMKEISVSVAAREIIEVYAKAKKFRSTSHVKY